MSRSSSTATVPSAHISQPATHNPTLRATPARMLWPTSRRSSAPTARRVSIQIARAPRRRSTGRNDSHSRSMASRPPVQ